MGNIVYTATPGRYRVVAEDGLPGDGSFDNLDEAKGQAEFLAKFHGKVFHVEEG